MKINLAGGLTMVNKAISLVKSMVFKLKALDIKLEEERLEKGLITGIDNAQANHKYYKNIQGLYAVGDKDITIKVKGIDTKLTVANCKPDGDNDGYISKLLRDYGGEYDKVDGDVLLLNCLLNPVDVNKALAARDGTILTYEKSLLEDNEDGLIDELNQFSIDFTFRWYVEAFGIVDDLYIISFLQSLAAALVNKVLAIRLQNNLTYRAYSKHIDNYLKSNFEYRIPDKFITKASKLWLHKHLYYFKNNLGFNNTIKILTDGILTPNDIDIGLVRLNKTTLGLNNNKGIDEASVGISPMDTVSIEWLNNTVNRFNTNNINGLENFIMSSNKEENELPLSNSLVRVNSMDNYIHSTKDGNSKDIILANKADTHISGIPFIRLALEHLAYFISNGSYKADISWRDEQTNTIYLINPLIGIILFYELIARYTKTNFSVRSLNYSSIINYDIDTLAKLKINGNLDAADVLASSILNAVPDKVDAFNSPKELGEYITKVNDWYTYALKTKSNVPDKHLSKVVVDTTGMLRKKGNADIIAIHEEYGFEYSFDFNLGDPSMDVILKDVYGINFIVNDSYDYTAAIASLFQATTGLNMERYISEDKLTYYKKLLSSILSYTVCISTDDTTPISLEYDNIGIVNSIKTNNKVLVKDIGCNSLEEPYCKLTAVLEIE